MERGDIYSGFAPRLWAVFFFVAAVAIVAGGYWYYHSETERIRTEKYEEIAAIAKLKAGQIEQWRQERLHDLWRSSKAPFFRKAVEEWIRNPDNYALKAQLQEWLVVQQKEQDYSDVLLLDSEYRVLLSAEPQPHPLSPTAQKAIEQSLADRTPMLSDLYRCQRGIVHEDAVTPLLDSENRPMALLVLRSNAESYLYPLIQSWPTPSRSAETLLVRREGEEVLFLNNLRHRPDSALSFQWPISKTYLPAVQAVLGKQGMYQGKDYRGVDVLADLRPIAQSPWFLVAKVDAGEILAEAHYRAWVVAIFTLLMFVHAAGVTAYAYKYRQAGRYRDFYRLEREQRTAMSEFRTTLYSIGDAVITTDPGGLVKHVNPVAEKLTGWKEDEAVERPILEVFNIVSEESRRRIESPVQRILREGTVVGLANHSLLIAKDGSERPIADSGAPIRNEDGTVIGVVLVFRDQTQERAAEMERRESQRRYRDLWEKAPVMMISLDRDSRILFASDHFCNELGYDRDEVIGRRPFEFQTEQSSRYAQSVVFPTFLQTGSIDNAPLQFIKKNGDVIDVLLNVTAERDAQGNIVRSRSAFVDITDRKRAEAALRESEERHRRLFEDAPLMYVITRNEQGMPHISGCNELFLESVGYSREEVIGHPLADFYSPESRSELLEGGGYARALSGVFSMGERQLVRRDGSFLPTLLYTATEVDASGKVTGTLAMFADITERKRTEEQLTESEERFRLAFENANIGLCIVSVQSRFLRVNDQICAIWGYSRSELEGMTVNDITHPEDRDISPRFIELALSGEINRAEFEKRYIHKHGHVVWGKVAISLVTDQRRNPLYFISHVQDITAAKEAEEDQRRLATALEQAAEGVIITDTKGIIQYVNPAVERITGFCSEELLGKTPAVFKSGEHDAAFYRQLWDTIKAGNTWLGRLVNKRKDGSLFHEDATISPVRNASGEITNFVAVKRDITEHLELSKQLFQAQKMEAVGTLAGGVAHDFNNILQVVLGYSELILSEEHLPERYRDDLEKVNRAARNGADLVGRLLTFSRKSEIKPLSINLNRRIEQLQKMLSRTIPKMIEIELILADNLSSVHADPTQVDQILMNLAVNARDAMPEGGRLTIRTENVILEEDYCRAHLGAKPGHYVLLSVSDTGKGMDNETMQHIFEPFFTTKSPGEGTGLGLAMVYGIVKQHGGHIMCYSEPSEGTIFKVYFPALISPAELPETETRALPQGGSETILIVDDEELIRDLGARILTRAGYKVLVAANGKKALEIYQARSDEISLVILDLIMPEMGGKQCLEALLTLDPAAKVVIASGYHANDATREALTFGAKGFINKPYDIPQVLAVLRSVLDRKTESNDSAD